MRLLHPLARVRNDGAVEAQGGGIKAGRMKEWTIAELLYASLSSSSYSHVRIVIANEPTKEGVKQSPSGRYVLSME